MVVLYVCCAPPLVVEDDERDGEVTGECREEDFVGVASAVELEINGGDEAGFPAEELEEADEEVVFDAPG